ncbi:ribosome recycling factor-domain-containing protein [Bisporella sp. PMI_857]|nr:ribosome recycling factor-domain-containing protein [Bisporella sp. PMI_857]
MAAPMRLNVLKHILPRSTSTIERQLIFRAAPQSLLTTTKPPQCRPFSASPFHLKKQGKEKSQQKASKASEPPEAETGADDPFDFSTLEAGIEKVLEKLKNDLSKLRTGGRFNPELLENVRVQLVKDVKGTERLGDLAQVLPKGGRTVMVLVGERDHVKPIVSAIQGSKDLNLQPQVDPHNASQLNIPIPPPTKESRDLAVAAAGKAGEQASLGVKNARAVMQKRLRAMELKKTVRPDDLKKAHKEVEKLVEKGTGDVKKTVEAARKGMEQS